MSTTESPDTDLTTVLSADEECLLGLLDSNNNGYYAHRFNHSSSVCLVAHVDTKYRKMPLNLKSQEPGWLYSETGVLGADDRAGVYIILKLLSMGLETNVLFCNGEESGGIGALKAYDELDMSHIKLFIELDFRGHMEYAVYHPQPQWVHDIPQSIGFTESTGTFTDIAIFYGTPGFNLSVGYYNQHTAEERLNLHSMDHTLSIMPDLANTAEKICREQMGKSLQRPCGSYRGNRGERKLYSPENR